MVGPSREVKISGFIICMNEEQRIGAALESIKWCDEIVIVDSGSADRTVEICQRYTDRIFKRDWPGFVAQKQFALVQCRGEWVLCIDADEVVSPELAEQIRTAVANDSGAVNGYLIPRVVFFLERWWCKGGWHPEYKLRLVRKSATVWGGEEPHDHPIVRGKLKKLRGDILHYTYDNMHQQILTLNGFSSIAAKMMAEKGRRFAVRRLILNPAARFFKFFISKRGYREGLAGFVVAVTEAYFVFLKYAKLWEIELSKRQR